MLEFGEQGMVKRAGTRQNRSPSALGCGKSRKSPIRDQTLLDVARQACLLNGFKVTPLDELHTWVTHEIMQSFRAADPPNIFMNYPSMYHKYRY